MPGLLISVARFSRQLSTSIRRLSVVSKMSGTIKLSNGFLFPNFGLGTWLSEPGEVGAAVVTAIEAGYRHIDCAYMYGNEAEIGDALKKVFAKGKVKREDLFIVSKLWNNRHRAEYVKPSLKESLELLGLDYLDLYLIHWPICFKAGKDPFPRDEQGKIIYDNVDHLETWKALESCVDEGLVRSIGLSNFNSQQIQNVLDNSRIKPTVLQVEVNLYLQQHKLVQFCAERGIVVTAFSCLGNPGIPTDHIGCPTSQLEDPKIVEIAKKLGRTPAQIILKWLVQRNIVPIPKSIKPGRVVENFNIWDFKLSAEDMTAINALNRNYRTCVPKADGAIEARDKNAPLYPFNIEF